MEDKRASKDWRWLDERYSLLLALVFAFNCVCIILYQWCFYILAVEVLPGCSPTRLMAVQQWGPDRSDSWWSLQQHHQREAAGVPPPGSTIFTVTGGQRIIETLDSVVILFKTFFFLRCLVYWILARGRKRWTPYFCKALCQERNSYGRNSAFNNTFFLLIYVLDLNFCLRLKALTVTESSTIHPLCFKPTQKINKWYKVWENV